MKTDLEFLGWLPGVRIRHFSSEDYGQIYVPFLNWTMTLFTVALTVHFGSSDRLAAADGTAVSTTMVLATVLLYSPAMPASTTIASSFVVFVPFDWHSNRVHDLKAMPLKAMPLVKRGIPRFEDQMYGQGVL